MNIIILRTDGATLSTEWLCFLIGKQCVHTIANLAIDENDLLNVSIADNGLVFVIDKLNTNSDDESDIEEIWIICTIAILNKKEYLNIQQEWYSNIWAKNIWIFVFFPL